MARVIRAGSWCLALLALLAAPASARQVAEIQVLPPNVTLFVDSTSTVIAQVFDQRGAPIDDAQIVWTSDNLSVARVTPNPGTPTATITGVSTGIAQIEARVGNVASIVVVQVQAAPAVEPQAQPARPTPAATPDSALAADISRVAQSLIARIEPHTFGFAQPCRIGAFIGANLLLTSYVAVRGSDSITVVLADGQRVTSGVRVASYDAQADLAVLQVPGRTGGEITIGQNPAAGDAAWAVAQPECQATATVLVAVRDATPPGLLTLAQSLGLGHMGAPLINRDGEMVGVAAGGSGAVRASSVRVLDVDARRNLAVGSLQSPAQVAAAEQHAFGTAALSSTLIGADARITPLEDWHWPELAQRGPLPISFAGPTGRYEVQLLAGGAVQSTATMTIQAGLATSVVLTPAGVVAGPQPQPQTDPTQIGTQTGGGGFPVAVVVLGLLGGGGAAAAFLLKPKENGGPGPITNGGTLTTKGGIIFTIPVIP